MSKFVTAFGGKDFVAQLVTTEKYDRIMGGVLKVSSLAALGMLAATLTVVPLLPIGAVGLVAGVAAYAQGAACQARATQTMIQTDHGLNDLKSVTGTSGFGRRFRQFLNPLKL